MINLHGGMLPTWWGYQNQSFKNCKPIWAGHPSDARYRTNITQTRLFNSDPLKPHFYVVKLGFKGVYIIFLIFAKKHRLWVLVRTASRGSSNEYPQSVLSRNMIYISEFLSENFQFSEMNFSIYILNRRVFVMFASPNHLMFSWKNNNLDTPFIWS